MDEKIREFLSEVEEPFIKFLYKYHTYPSCCHLASSLIATYLSSHTNYEFKHKYYREKYANVSHSWVQCGDYIYDLVWYQDQLETNTYKDIEDQTTTGKPKLVSYRKHLKKIDRPRDSVFNLSYEKELENNPKSSYYYTHSAIEIPKQEPYSGVISKLSVDEFMKFAREYSKKIKNKLTVKEDPSTGFETLKCLL
ncbi:hypothetical protein ACDZ28_00915 (plasmid) [Paenibacillus sp. RS8]|uniref:hypothetical protein n=1 Tax=Paenibacillus sp. RS8 TaxID=3242681 RepID=UPI0035C06B5F